MGLPRFRTIPTRAGLVVLMAGPVGALSPVARAQDNPLEAPDEKVIQYTRSDDLADPVALLQKALDAGTVRLDHAGARGYLPAVLKLLKVKLSSQTLVFSR